MYYDSNKHTDDYYNAYKREMQELEDYEKQYQIQQLIKIIFLFIVVILLGFVSYYIYGYFNTYIESSNKIEKTMLKEPKQLIPIIGEEELPQSPQLIAYQKNATDITEEKKTNISKKDITLIIQIIREEMNTQKELKESNHYNKVIVNNNQLETNETIQNSKLVELTNNMNHILEETVEDKVETKYITSIKKEIAYRENEMRVIVVKKG